MTQPSLLTVEVINNLIEVLIGDDAQLCATERDGEIYLYYTDYDTPAEIKLDDEDRTRERMPPLLYEYAVWGGYTNEDYGDWLGA